MERIDATELLALKGGNYIFGFISRIVWAIATSIIAYRWRR